MILYGMELGATAASSEGYGGSSEGSSSTAARSARRGNRVRFFCSAYAKACSL
jgi:hypothetical protein